MVLFLVFEKKKQDNIDYENLGDEPIPPEDVGTADN
jgi:hypothetical protein